MLCAMFLIPHALAHEVYVLTPAEITRDVAEPSMPFWSVMMEHFNQFTFWAFLSILLVLFVLFISVSRRLEKTFDPMLFKLKPFAPLVGRVTFGLSLFAGAYYQAIYGPELSFAAVFGPLSGLVTALFVACGVAVIAGVFVRQAAAVCLALYLAAAWHAGSYILTYTNYLGEIMVLLLLGAEPLMKVSKLKRGHPGTITRLLARLRPYSFLLLRICFSVSLLYASWYAKILHSNLAFDVVEKYRMTDYFHFDPHFFVMGAAIVELVIGLFFLLGIEIRFTAFFLDFWITLSVAFFGETVWPHIILVGIPVAYILYGYDRYSVEGYFLKKDDREPVL